VVAYEASSERGSVNAGFGATCTRRQSSRSAREERAHDEDCDMLVIVTLQLTKNRSTNCDCTASTDSESPPDPSSPLHPWVAPWRPLRDRRACAVELIRT
jgi:hypothetical protein